MSGVDVAPCWHGLEGRDALAALASDAGGLSSLEAERRLFQHGPNRVSIARRRSRTHRFLSQLHNVLLYVLLAAAAITAGLGHWADTGVILGVVLINAVIGYVQEGRAEHAIEAIRALLTPRTTVLRDGAAGEIHAEAVVPGDVVLLSSGDRVTADLRLLDARRLEIDESFLTGESLPVMKHVHVIPAESPLAERSNMAYAGTLVTQGTARGVATATGRETEIGRISEMMQRVEPITTPLLEKISGFGRVLSVLILILATAVSLFGYLFHHYPLADMLIAAVGIAVAAIPEGLPPVITITLAIGVQRMASRSAYVRRLPAVETLGEVDAVLTDKTGTLTRNEMTVRLVATDAAEVHVGGAGYEPRGDITVDHEILVPGTHPSLMALARAVVLCNDARIVKRGGAWAVEGDPTEGALVVFAAKCGLDAEQERRTYPRVDVIPFESEQRFMATQHDGRVYLKGAPETLLELCVLERTDTGDRALERTMWLERAAEMADRGHRVLAICEAELDPERTSLMEAQLFDRLSLLGLVGVSDPPRPEARAALERCRTAGIEVKMITGDHPRTAAAIARELGLGDGRSVLTGMELERLDGDALLEAAREVDVFARATPELKLRLVAALQSDGDVVAMTGDGVNDAPALKRADIGVAMGLKGTEAAKEAAEMVLADDNFATIISAVEQGRIVDDNIRKSILFLLPTSIAEALVLILAILFGYTLPMTPLQILWVNMITAVTLGIAMAFEPAEEGVMRREPRAAQAPILSTLAVWRTCFVGAFMVLGVSALFAWSSPASDLENARTIAVNALVLFEAVYLLSCRHLSANAFTHEGLTGNRVALACIAIVVLFQLAFTYTAPFQNLFETAAIDAGAWLLVGAAALLFMLMVELEKGLIRAARERNTTNGRP
jgi:magnesium-transporting ATPase (P-type)